MVVAISIGNKKARFTGLSDQYCTLLFVELVEVGGVEPPSVSPLLLPLHASFGLFILALHNPANRVHEVAISVRF